MANEINSLFDAAAALTITLADLASSTTGVGQSSVIVNNTAAGTKYQTLHIYVRIHTHETSAVTANTQAAVYLLQADAGSSPTYTDDGWAGTDAAITIINARPLGIIRVTATTANTPYFGKFTVRNPGPGWGIAIVQNTGQNLNATGSDMYVRYVGENPEVQ